MIKQTLPQVKVAAGGIHASAGPEEFPEAGQEGHGVGSRLAGEPTVNSMKAFSA